MDTVAKLIQSATRKSIPTFTYQELTPNNAAERRSLIRKYQLLLKAREAWQAASDALWDSTPAGDLDPVSLARAERVSEMSEKCDRAIDDTKSAAEQAEDDEKRNAANVKALAMAGLKPIRMASMMAIYNAAERAYNGSNAMMIDDAMRGADSAAKRVGLSVVTDWGWFPVVYTHVRAGRSWRHVQPDKKQQMLDFANEELIQKVNRRTR